MKTKENSNTGAIFGSAGVIAGIVIIVFAITILPDITAFLLLILGAFFTFTHQGTQLDMGGNIVFQYTALFGIFKTGEKFELKEFDTIALLPDNESHRIFSKGNRSMDYTDGKVIIVMISDTLKKNIVLKRFKDVEKAQAELKQYSSEFSNMEVLIQVENK